MDKVSPFAPVQVPVLPPIEGVRLAACEAGIRYAGRTDLLLALFEPSTAVAGVFTTSKTASAAVEWCREHVRHGMARALVVNSGNANAFTGMRGREAVAETVRATARIAECLDADVYVASTGVIGEPLDPSKFVGFLAGLAERAQADAYEMAARAIMTTDTFPKLATRTCEIGGVTVTLNGIAKGAGMIAPDMATMLSFLFTDAPIEPAALQSVLSPLVEDSFNAITIDSDTSTSDTVLLFATGAAERRSCPRIADGNDERLAGFRAALFDLMRDLAHQIVQDGEGLTKFVSVTVKGAESKASARTIAKAICNSPLVKTALAGEDPNWGRIVMAVGKAGEAADRDRLAIWFGDIEVAKDGEVAPSYKEVDGAAYMKRPEIDITVDVGIGEGTDTMWTCDLTKEYIAINADYRS
ncbi:bifunctional glutamate N-acetyltransferase/amino-acid acetyltransferase ArgJ [Methyloceanibacter caenitepidi]|uniref:Arginine biosynthesis bifunctional protein ArgJ n=1 Tax=Methyloceanibacter caenitepidi TaxID=1384459 RepID=A0A0A8K844_9HYPH|nr:bifunctional glutamate N-acetyltransferase/amino-acid acetyltransferase ArgJ [Methyloceanibacter caenitepidi]BAQ18707.1 glutamate N-acetyltransferase [Methyloceanibacter caenitepidi]